jgi:hypothetical protein
MTFQSLRDWLDVAQLFAVLLGFIFTTISIRQNTKERRLSNLLTITSHHRDLWQHFSDRPQLYRVLKPDASLEKKPPSVAEREFVNLIILHLRSAFQVYKGDASFSPDGLRQDVAEFFSLPIPKEVWNRCRRYHDEEFISFVDEARKLLRDDV